MITSIREYRKYINEGLIKCYPIDNINLHKISLLNIKEENYKITKIDSYNFKLELFNNFNSFVIEQIVNKIVTLYGYFPNKYTIKYNIHDSKFDSKWNIQKITNILNIKSDMIKSVDLYFECDLTDVVTGNSVAYHYASSISIKNIFKKGLLNRSNSRVLDHPKRIYVFTDLNVKDNFLKKLKDSDKYNSIDQEYTLLEIDLKDSNILLREDPKYLSFGLFTYDYIQPSRIKII